MATVEVVLQPAESGVEDTYISSEFSSFNYGVSTALVVGNNQSNNHPYRSLLRFDVSSVIPEGNVFVSAVLQLYCWGADSSSGSYIRAYRSLVQWYEGIRNHATVAENGSTWTYRNANVPSPWNGGPGGNNTGFPTGSDYAGSYTAETVVTSTFNWYSWDVSADVAAFLNGTATNYGWFLLARTDTGVPFRKNFYSSSYSGATFRPKLIITYESPENMHSTLAGSATLAGTLTRGERYGVTVLQPHGSDGIDSRIRQTTPTSNSGGQVLISVGSQAAASTARRGLIKFDLSSLPAGIEIEQAQLFLHRLDSSDAVSTLVGLHRSLVDWQEGNLIDTVPGAGVDASTWNLRNANGSVPWAGGAGGAAGVDWLAEAIDEQLVGPSSSVYAWEVGEDVQSFLDGAHPNYGWWILGVEGSGVSTLQSFDSSDGPTSGWHPWLVIHYTDPDIEMQVSLAGSSTLGGTLRGVVRGQALIGGTSDFEAALVNVAVVTLMPGAASITASLTARGSLSASLGGTSMLGGKMEGRAQLRSVMAATGAMEAEGSFAGQLRTTMQGLSMLIARANGRARNVIQPARRNAAPLLYLTDGVERFNLLDADVGYLLCEWKPAVAQYKAGGQWSDSSMANGRRLIMRRFMNAIEVMTFSATGKDQDELAFFTNELFRWGEAAADYWASRWSSATPVYLVSRAAYETNERYAAVMMMSVPQLENLYSQPFFINPARSPGRPAFEEITLRLERGAWQERPPGLSSAVPISSVRSWTVSGWETDS